MLILFGLVGLFLVGYAWVLDISEYNYFGQYYDDIPGIILTLDDVDPNRPETLAYFEGLQLHYRYAFVLLASSVIFGSILSCFSFRIKKDYKHTKNIIIGTILFIISISLSIFMHNSYVEIINF